ncbi:MAG: Tm-1-like ATP-binding domain-containing protein [Pseudaminobacter sp.]|nr:Tm-1-like ATP-binding domain-containing protein [Pseudaminobacter sp.]
MKRIYVVGTADTKGEELDYLLSEIRSLGSEAVGVDVGTQSDRDFGITARQVLESAPPDIAEAAGSGDRGVAVAAMGAAFAAFMRKRDDVAGVIGVGGGGGTSIVTAGMRELRLGLPKIMVSTLASGDVGAYVGVSDIMMTPSVTDMAGLNRITRTVLGNAAAAIVAMSGRKLAAQNADRPAIGLTMFGVTTPCVTMIADHLRDGGTYDPLIFHATGTGGRSMEKLADSGMLAGIIDITTTEICDLLFGGVLPAGEDRLDAIARTKIPYVGSVGALDMVNFWAPETVPERYQGRLLYKHNPNVTLMRTTADESRAIGAWIGRKLNACEGPVRFLIPEKGVSALDIEGGVFFDPQADEVLFSAIEAAVTPTPKRRVERLPFHINDPEFAGAALAAFREIASQ